MDVVVQASREPTAAAYSNIPAGPSGFRGVEQLTV
jgi:hypothetical protein